MDAGRRKGDFAKNFKSIRMRKQGKWGDTACDGKRQNSI